MPSAAGPYTVPLYKLATMVAECAAFQEACGFTYPMLDEEGVLLNGDGGKKRIFYPGIEDADYGDFPLAIISAGEEWTMRLHAGGDRNYSYSPSGSLELMLMNWATGENNEFAARSFLNFIGQVISGDDDNPGLWQLSAADDRLAINEITQFLPPQMCSRTEESQREQIYWQAGFTVRYGLSG